MFHVGDHVLYGIHGICRITDVEERIVDRKKVYYFVLEPQDQAGAKYYIPTHNEAALAKLRHVIGKEELEALLKSDAVRVDSWIADENQRKQRYRELINSGDRAALLQMIGSLHRHRAQQAEAGRKFHQCDENFLRDAEKRLASELEYVLNTDFDQAKNYLRQKLKAE